MSVVPVPKYTFAEYLTHEKSAAIKSEYYRGQIYAMAGGSLRHNAIASNLLIGVGGRLRDTPCRARNSDQRIRIPANGLATYPDVSVFCGEPQTDNEDPDAIVNPRVIFEVLSKSTESYDRGKKFDLYCELDSLQEYVLVAQDEPKVDRLVRQQDGSWNLTIFKGLQAELNLAGLGCALPLSEIYEGVSFGAEDVTNPQTGSSSTSS